MRLRGGRVSGSGAPRGIPEHLGDGRGSVPRFVLQKVQIVRAHSYIITFSTWLLHTWVGMAGWELQWVIGLDRFWVHASCVLQRVVSSLFHTHAHTFTHIVPTHIDIYVHVSVCVCLYLRDSRVKLAEFLTRWTLSSHLPRWTEELLSVGTWEVRTSWHACLGPLEW